MKKLRLNKLFHWLYAILMLTPFIIFASTILIYFSTGAQFLTEDEFSVSQLWVDSWQVVFNYGFVSPIKSVFDYLLNTLLGLDSGTQSYEFIIDPLVWWVYVSIAYLVFDVLMYPVNLFHRWIDEGGI